MKRKVVFAIAIHNLQYSYMIIKVILHLVGKAADHTQLHMYVHTATHSGLLCKLVYIKQRYLQVANYWLYGINFGNFNSYLVCSANFSSHNYLVNYSRLYCSEL